MHLNRLGHEILHRDPPTRLQCAPVRMRYASWLAAIIRCANLTLSTPAHVKRKQWRLQAQV